MKKKNVQQQQDNERQQPTMPSKPNIPSGPNVPSRPMMPPNGSQPQQPLGPQQPMIPQQPMMPQQPIMPMPYYMYPPESVYNPITTPPYVDVPSTRPPGRELVDFEMEPGPPVTVDRNFIQGYLRTVIGRYIRAEFILGTNMFVDREGTLVDVGVDHIVLREPETDDLVIADLYSIKFVRVYY